MKKLLLLCFVFAVSHSAFAAVARLQVDTKTHALTDELGGTIIDAKGVSLTVGGFTVSDASGVKTIVLGSTSGTKIGNTGDKIGFFGVTPIIRPGATTDLRIALINLGLYTTGGATPLNLNGGTLTSGPITGTTIAGTNQTLSGTLGVTGNTTIGGTLAITGSATGSSLTLSGNGSVAGTFSVTGASTLHAISGTNETLSGTLGVTGNSTFSGTVGITGATTASSLALSGNETVGGTLSITGPTSGAAFSFTGNGTVGGTFGVTGITTLNALNATTGTFSSSISATNATLSGTLGITGALTGSSASFSGNETVGGTLAITGATSGSAFSFTGNGTVGGTFGVTGVTTLGPVSATNGTFSGTLGVTGTFTGQAVSSTAFSGPGDAITTTEGTASRTLQVKLRDSVSLKDFGGVGDGSTNNNAAITAAMASAYPVIYVPEGTYVSTLSNLEATLAGKRFIGPGFIQGSNGSYPSYQGPANFTRIDTSPSNGGESLYAGNYQLVNADKFILDGDSRQSLDSAYYNYSTIPHITEANFRSGGSGFTAYIAANANPTDTVVTLNAVDELNVGDTIDFYSTYAGTGNRHTITAINTGAKQITLNSAVGTSGNPEGHYVSNRDWVLKYARTHNDVYFTQLHHLAGGDAYIYGGRVFAYREIPAGAARDFELNSTAGFIGGDLNAAAEGGFLTPYEFAVYDHGHNIAAMSMINYQRTIGPYPDIFSGIADPTLGKYGALWVGNAVTSGGTQPLDAGYQIRGYTHVGFDFVPGLYNAGCAIGLGDGQKIFFNNAQQPSDTFTAATSDLITPAAQSRPGGRLEFNNGDRVRVLTTGTLPGGLVFGTDYFVVSATSTTLKLSATLGGSPIDITSTGSGTHTLTSSLGKSGAVGDVIGDLSVGYNSATDDIEFKHGTDVVFAVSATGIKAGGRNGVMKGWLTTTFTHAFGTVNPGAYATWSVSVPGAADGDAVEVGVPTAADLGMFWKGTVTSPGGVTVVCYNPYSPVATAVNAPSATFTVAVKKF